MAHPTDPDPAPAADPGPPRWVKVAGIVGALVVVVLVVTMLVGGGHGPGRHTSGGAGDVPSSAVARAHTSPPGGHP